MLAALVMGSSADPYQPGTPGGPWSKEEIDIVREKVLMMIFLQWKTVIWFGIWIKNP